MNVFKKITAVFLFFVVAFSGTTADARDNVTFGEANALAHSLGSGGSAVRIANDTALESSPIGEFFKAVFNFAVPGPLCTLDYHLLQTGFVNRSDMSPSVIIKGLRDTALAYEIDGVPVDSTRGAIKANLGQLEEGIIGYGYIQYRIFEPGELSVGEHDLLTIGTFADGEVVEIPSTFTIKGPNDPACQDDNGHNQANQQEGKGKNK